MKKDLTTSEIDRQNILNNPYALAEIEKATGVQGIQFEGRTVVFKEQVAAFFEVTPRTVDNYLEKCGTELERNGYEVLRCKRLKDIKLSIRGSDVHETGFVDISKIPQLGVEPDAFGLKDKGSIIPAITQDGRAPQPDNTLRRQFCECGNKAEIKRGNSKICQRCARIDGKAQPHTAGKSRYWGAPSQREYSVTLGGWA